jgi:hypothetical protein
MHAHVPLKKKITDRRNAKSYRELERKIQVHNNTDVKKYLTKMLVHHKAHKAKNFAPKTTARQQSVIKARLKFLTQKMFYV